MGLDDEVVSPPDMYEGLVFTQEGKDSRALIALLNTRTVYFPPRSRKVNWKETDRWREAGIEELPHPPAGYRYLFDAHSHLVSLVGCDDASYVHVRRKIRGDAHTHAGMAGYIALHLAEKAARQREGIQEALAQTRTLVAERKRLAKQAASVTKK